MRAARRITRPSGRWWQASDLSDTQTKTSGFDRMGVRESTRVRLRSRLVCDKAALVTMAYDQRLAIELVGSSGERGARLHRRNFGEAVENPTELLPLDPGDWLDDEDLAALHQALKDSDEDVTAGRLVDAVVLRQLRSR
jgi:hypothetical protein